MVKSIVFALIAAIMELIRGQKQRKELEDASAKQKEIAARDRGSASAIAGRLRERAKHR